MRFTFVFAIFFVFLTVKLSTGLPVKKNHDDEKKNGPGDHHELHPEESGTLERSALDEERRMKVELLKHYYTRKRELETGEYLDPFKQREHGDPAQIHAPEIAELDRAIVKITNELTNIDHKRRQLFKEYEMQKRVQEMHEEKGLDEEKRKKFHEEQEKLRQKHRQHESLNHPLSEPQLEEVWEREDDIQQKFDAETFFNLHDVDGNKVWDPTEVASLFKIELDKMYEKGMPEDDLRERNEEMERMREHVFQEADLNKNGLIEYDEFLKQIEKPESRTNEGWEGLDQTQLYSPEELDAYIKNHPDPEAAYAALNNLAPPSQNNIDYQQVPVQQHGDPNVQYYQGQRLHPIQYQNEIPQQYQQQQGQHIPDHNQPIKVPLHQQQQQLHYQQVPVQQQQLLPQQQYQMPRQQVPRDQIPLEQQYHHQVVEQTQQVQQNIPNQPVQHQQQQQQQQLPQSVQPQQIVNQDHNTQNQASLNQPVVQQHQQQQQQQQPQPPQQQQQQQQPQQHK